MFGSKKDGIEIPGHHGVAVSIDEEGNATSPRGAQHALKALGLYIAGLSPADAEEIEQGIAAARVAGEEIPEISVAATFSGEDGHEVTVFRDGSVKHNRQHDDAVALLGQAAVGSLKENAPVDKDA